MGAAPQRGSVSIDFQMLFVTLDARRVVLFLCSQEQFTRQCRVVVVTSGLMISRKRTPNIDSIKTLFREKNWTRFVGGGRTETRQPRSYGRVSICDSDSQKKSSRRMCIPVDLWVRMAAADLPSRLVTFIRSRSTLAERHCRFV
jgi:hypothetical protein